MNKKLASTIKLAAVACLTLSMNTFAEAEQGTNSIRVILDGKTNYYQTTDGTTVREFLADNNISVKKDTKVSKDLNQSINDNMLIEITNPTNVLVKIDNGTRKTVSTNAKTVGAFIDELEQNSGITYKVENANEKDELKNGKTYMLTTTKSIVSSKLEDLPYDTTKMESPDLYIGETKVKQVGVIGVKKVVTTTTYIGNVQQGTKTREEIVIEPVPEIIAVGTKAKEEAQGGIIPELNASYSRVITLDATAYCPCSQCCGSWANGYTASGIKAGYGVAAVDTRVIPLGTKLYVEGYGYCIAADTGGAIKGSRIDLCYNTHSQALASGFGHKNVKVYILN